MLGVRCGGCRSVQSAGRCDSARACRLRVGLASICLPAGVLTRGVAGKGHALNEPKSGVPTSVPITRERQSETTITIGIDPHKASHTAVAIDDSECVLDGYRLRACSDQADQLRAWAAPFPERVWAIESARGLGYLLAQQLVAAGESVVDVPAGVVDTHTSVGIRSGTEERPEQRTMGRDRHATQPGTHPRQSRRSRPGVEAVGQTPPRSGPVTRRDSEPAACAADGTPTRRHGEENERDQGQRNPRRHQHRHRDRRAPSRGGSRTVADLVHIETQMKASKARLRRAVAAASTSLTDIQHSSDPAEGRLQIDTHNPEPDDRLTAASRCPTAAPHSHRHVRRRRALR